MRGSASGRWSSGPPDAREPPLLRGLCAALRSTGGQSCTNTWTTKTVDGETHYGFIHGNFALEVGNPALESERAFGFDLSLRWRRSRA